MPDALADVVMEVIEINEEIRRKLGARPPIDLLALEYLGMHGPAIFTGDSLKFAGDLLQ